MTTEDKPISAVVLMTDQQKAEEFLREHRELVLKYGFDFVAQIGLTKINVNPNPNNINPQPAGDSVPDKAPEAIK